MPRAGKEKGSAVVKDGSPATSDVTACFLLGLKTAADAARTAEGSFRREAALRIAALEQESALAFRRFDLMQAISGSMDKAESDEIAVANAFAALRARLDWKPDSEPRVEVMARFAPVALAVFRAQATHEDKDASLAHKALMDFERWYMESRGSSFWSLCERSDTGHSAHRS